ncbi:type 1 glutamine amidotransferase domain-containing protein [Acinetobacter sp. BS1]|nr:type 1 glutamine amidotransferase domain-containing protein [Acinetobacter pittii]OYP76573.1 type 1 glutamine amidotransferase domain-containing protein [Acinetobacter sp. BS1]
MLAVVTASAAFSANAAHVLVVLSDEAQLELKKGHIFKTGFYLNELMQPTKMLLDAGHTVTFATPKGKAPTLDESSNNAMYFNQDEKALKQYANLLHDLKLTSAQDSPVVSLSRIEQIGVGQFDAIYIPGGHAPMQDLLKDKQLGKVLTAFHKAGKPTALVCHGPIALMSTLPNASEVVGQLEQGKPVKTGSWIYKNYRMTVISNQEEEQAKALLKGGEMKFYPQTALQSLGAEYQSNTTTWTPNVVVDRELITGQNPASAVLVGKTLLEKLK